MKPLATSFLIAGLLSTVSASAQNIFRFGIRGGFNRTTTTVAVAETGGQSSPFSYTRTADKSAISAWQAGITAELIFGKISLQPALVFTQKGERFHYYLASYNLNALEYSSDNTGTTRANWLELPLNVVYTLHGTHGLQLFAGPYLAVAVGGRQDGINKIYSSSSPITPSQYDDPIEYGRYATNRRMDAGINAGVGYRQGPFQMQLGYGLGLYNLHQAAVWSTKPSSYQEFRSDDAYNRGFQLTGTYFFSL
ncbi:MAG: outer membrane beta-barrel protein [Janthinobacterium lividum]